jgi:thioredoxin 1
MPEIVNTTDARFEKDVGEAGKLVIVDMWAEWCGPCRMMEPVLEEVSKEYAQKVKVVKLNIDQNQDIAIKYGVGSIPTFLFFRDGKEIDRVTGAFPKKQFAKKIDAHLENR